MADIFPATSPFRVLPPQNGQILSFGSTSDENPSGAWAFTFIPSIDWDGGFVVLGRPPRISTADLTVPWLPVPYRRVTVNNVCSDYAMVSDGLALAVSGPYQILVPACGISIGLLVACNAGVCMIYGQKVTGSTIP